MIKRNFFFIICLVCFLFVSCSSKPSNDIQIDVTLEPPGGPITFNLTGDVTFAGALEIEQVGIIGRDPIQPVDTLFSQKLDSGAIVEVHLLVPDNAYKGVGEYFCGTEVGLDAWEYQYCTITIRHYVNSTTIGTWTTQGIAIAPGGVFGPLDNCSIIITEVSDFIQGTVNCSSFEYVGDPGHPDAENSITGLSDKWHFKPLNL